MKVSGFTIVKNAVKFNYPVCEAIRSILPICDEFIVNVGDSEDGTLALIQSINDPKIRIIQTQWNMAQGSTVLSEQTNVALNACKGDWAFYVQSDEVIHEDDLPAIKQCLRRHLNDETVDALRFRWLHFYGSFWRYRIDKGWYQKQDRIVRNNGQVISVGDAFGFARRDGKPLRQAPTGCLLYHYGWVNSTDDLKKRLANAAAIGYADNTKEGELGDLNRFVPYFGTHPAVMKERIAAHEASARDWMTIRQRYWWNPLLWFRTRIKTGRRIKTSLA